MQQFIHCIDTTFTWKELRQIRSFWRFLRIKTHPQNLQDKQELGTSFRVKTKTQIHNSYEKAGK